MLIIAFFSTFAAISALLSIGSFIKKDPTRGFFFFVATVTSTLYVVGETAPEPAGNIASWTSMIVAAAFFTAITLAKFMPKDNDPA